MLGFELSETFWLAAKSSKYEVVRSEHFRLSDLKISIKISSEILITRQEQLILIVPDCHI